MFLALIFSTVEGFRPGTGTKIKNRYRAMGALVFSAFLLGIGTAALATAWLVGHHGWTYNAMVWLFATQLALVVVAASLVTYDVLK